MKLPTFDYVEPKSLGKSCRLLQEQGTDAKIIAGGTDLMMALKQRLTMPKLLVGLNRIPALRKMSYSKEEGLKIGAMVSLRRLASHKVIREKYPMLAEAALSVGSAQLQAMGTVGGNICQDNCCIYYSRSPLMRQGIRPCLKSGGSVCHVAKGSASCWATYCGDIAPVLLALRATATLADVNGEKIIPLGDIFSGNGAQPQSLRPSQILTEIQLPPPHNNRSGGTYLKMRMRKAIDYPLLGVAVTMSREDNRDAWEDVTIGLTAVDKSPVFIQAAVILKEEKDFSKVTAALAEAAFKSARPIANTYGYSPTYRREMVKVYVKQAMHESQRIALGTGGAA